MRERPPDSGRFGPARDQARLHRAEAQLQDGGEHRRQGQQAGDPRPQPAVRRRARARQLPVQGGRLHVPRRAAVRQRDGQVPARPACWCWRW